ncbi:hypothetical protein ILUMI_08642 [Ignelater luminosus]|uniref:Uncharacterized protein n=1 Tax=Ignelater luminosus TaxID=2038154 RepID=A0A8K0D792_IGNLU|nr:hypothetical protein ILUMI_08642 [Ignelater luminosus]
MANKRGLSDGELKLELLHGLPEDCSDPESNASARIVENNAGEDEEFHVGNVVPLKAETLGLEVVEKAKNVLENGAGPTAHAKTNVTEERVSSSERLKTDKFALVSERKNELQLEKESLPKNVVIMEPYLRTKRNVTTDNFFMSIKLSERLKAMKPKKVCVLLKS